MLSFDMCDRIGSLRRYLEEKNFENLDNIVILSHFYMISRKRFKVAACSTPVEIR